LFDWLGWGVGGGGGGGGSSISVCVCTHNTVCYTICGWCCVLGTVLGAGRLTMDDISAPGLVQYMLLTNRLLHKSRCKGV